MKELLLQRKMNTPEGMFGELWYMETRIAHTIECPWRNNISNLSCIPAGSYICEYTYSPTFRKYLYILLNVPKRSGIRIHSGNVAGMRDKGMQSDFMGCIGLGMSLGRVYGQRAILSSVRAMGLFDKLVERDTFILTITGDFKAL